MDFEITQEANYAIVKTKVEKLDANNSTNLKSELLLLNKSGINNLILDLSDTRYCDSSGLSAVLTANRLCRDSSGEFIMCGLQDPVLKMVKISQLDRVLRISDDRTAAISAMTSH
jgi:anti-sigma B factor antagonist